MQPQDKKNSPASDNKMQFTELQSYRKRAEVAERDVKLLQARLGTVVAGTGLTDAQVEEMRSALRDLLVIAENQFLDEEGKLLGRLHSNIGLAMQRAEAVIRPAKK